MENDRGPEINCTCWFALDEPTTGVHPPLKRNIWSVVHYCQKANFCSPVWSSHSIEECEALCSRLGIIIKSQFRCQGQHYF